MKSRIMLVLVIALFLISGCSSEKQQEGDVEFRRGTRGLEMRFVESNPPNVVYENDVLPIGIELYNRGASAIEHGRLYITGYDKDLITNWDSNSGAYTGSLPSNGVSFNIEDHRTQFNREGGYKYKQFTSGEIDLPTGVDKYRIPLVLYGCYEYETIASDSVCVDPQPHRPYTDKPCNTQDLMMSGGQGAPVAVTHVDVENMRDSMRFTFHIQNSGKGDIIDINKWKESCPVDLSPADMNYVDYDLVKIGNDRDITHNCQPSGKVKISNGRGRVTCTANIGGETAYKTPIEIKLKYAYRTLERKNVQIRRYD